jgi:hypothetical protein
MNILLWLAASAVDDPEMPAKKTDRSTFTWASAPGKWPTMVRDRCTSRSVMPPLFIRLAVSRKNGTASRMNELYALKVSLKSDSGDRRGSITSIGRHDRPRATATGTRITSSPKKPPKRISAAMPGLIAALITAPARRCARPAGTAHPGRAPR